MNKIEFEIASNIEKFKRVVIESNGIGDICKKYQFPDNGKTRSLIKNFINQNSLSIIHFGLKSRPRKYVSIEKICPSCKSMFKTLNGHPREKKTCSSKCANYFFAKPLSVEQKEKIKSSIRRYHNSDEWKVLLSLKNKNYLYEKPCKICKSNFKPKSIRMLYCSKKCQHSSVEYRDKLRQTQLKRVANGTHSGWKSRSNPSYAELFFMNVLSNNKIEYAFEETCGKYFIDFAIHSKKIALEIDGKQHLREDKKTSDQEKDVFLQNQGWRVYRIPWKSINSVSGKQFIEHEINKFIEYYNNKF